MKSYFVEIAEQVARPSAWLTGFAGALMLVGQAAGQTAPAKPAAPAAPIAPPPAAVDPILQAAAKAFDELPEAERKAIQDALIWTGDYNGVVDGNFGRLSFEAVRAFQRKAKANQNGILAEAQRKALREAADKARAAAKFAVVTDGIGLRIGVPRAAAPKSASAGAGTKYFADKDAFTLETILVRAGSSSLEDMFETAKQATAERKVTYRLLRPDFFVISGDEKGRRFYLRLSSGPSGLRGYRLSYPISKAAEYDRLSIAIANSFEAYPNLPGAPVVASAPKPAEPIAAPPTRPVLSANGVLLSDGRVLTALAAFAECADPRIGGQPVTVLVRDEGSGLALVRSAGVKADAWSRAPRGEPVREGEELVVAVVTENVAESGFATATALTPSTGVRWRAQAAFQAGGLGAPLFDRRGAIVGIVVEGRRTPFTVAGVVPASAYGAASAGALDLFFKDNGVTLTGPAALAADRQSAGAVAAAVAASVVAITCRK